MRFFVSAGPAFAISFISVLAAMLVNHWFGLAKIQPWLAFCIACGIAVALGAQAHWHLSRRTGGALIGLLGGLSYVVGTWLSAHA